MPRVLSVTPLENYGLEVTFEDGVRGLVSLKERLFGPMFEPLLETALFNEVFVDEFGAIAWPNGADLAPDALYQRLRVFSSAK